MVSLLNMMYGCCEGGVVTECNSRMIMRTLVSYWCLTYQQYFILVVTLILLSLGGCQRCTCALLFEQRAAASTQGSTRVA